MIWAILILLGIPLWLIAIALISLIRARSQVKHLPGSFDCKLRRAAAPGKPTERFTRYTARAQWVHEVLILHGGNPFLIATTPYGVTDILEGPATSASDARLKRMAQPVSLLLRTDSEDVVELVFPAASVETARGSFGSASAEP